MFWETSLVAILEITAIAAADRGTAPLPSVGLQGAKPMVVGRLSVNVQESAMTAVAFPFVVVCIWS
jgi:hypothetical protein